MLPFNIKHNPPNGGRQRGQFTWRNEGELVDY